MIRIHQIRSVQLSKMGQRLPIRDNSCSFQPSGTIRNYQASISTDDNSFSESHQPSMLSLSILYNDSVDIEALGRIEDELVLIETSGGKHFSMPGAFCASPPRYNGQTVEMQLVANRSFQL